MKTQNKDRIKGNAHNYLVSLFMSLFLSCWSETSLQLKSFIILNLARVINETFQFFTDRPRFLFSIWVGMDSFLLNLILFFTSNMETSTVLLVFEAYGWLACCSQFLVCSNVAENILTIFLIGWCSLQLVCLQNLPCSIWIYCLHNFLSMRSSSDFSTIELQPAYLGFVSQIGNSP